MFWSFLGKAVFIVGATAVAVPAYNSLSDDDKRNVGGLGALVGVGFACWSIYKKLSRKTDRFTLQYFGSDRNQVPKASAGCIIKNKGQFVVAAAYNLDSECNVAIAEAIALKNGLELALKKYVKLDCVQGRNEEICNRVLGREKRPPRFEDLNSIIRDIRYVFNEYHGIDPNNLELVDEETIKVARELATVGGTLEKKAMVYRTVQDLPPRVARLVNVED